MMRCETCLHECTVVDFVTLRNLCEHLYLDSLAQKDNPSWVSSFPPNYTGKDHQDLCSKGYIIYCGWSKVVVFGPKICIGYISGGCKACSSA